jgi:hypothetical protein
MELDHSLPPVVVSPSTAVALRSRCWGAGAVLASAVLASAGTCLALVVPPARAIPEAEVMAKLGVIPVFVITNAEGVPLPIPRDKTMILPLFLDRSRAESERSKLASRNPQLQTRLLPLPMNQANEKVLAMRQKLKTGLTLEAPIIPLASDLEQGGVILRQQGLTAKQVKDGLNIPVFFTKPFIVLPTPGGKRGVFFFSYGQMQEALASLPNRSTLVPQVADLTAVVHVMLEAAQDQWIFYPTREYFRLVKEQQAEGRGSSSSQRQPGAVAPSALPSAPPPLPKL